MSNIHEARLDLVERLEGREAVQRSPHHTTFLVPNSAESDKYWFGTGERIAEKTVEMLIENNELFYAVIFPGTHGKIVYPTDHNTPLHLFDSTSKVNIDEERPFTKGFLSYLGVEHSGDITSSSLFGEMTVSMNTTALRNADDYTELEQLALRSGYYLPGVRVDLTVDGLDLTLSSAI